MKFTLSANKNRSFWLSLFILLISLTTHAQSASPIPIQITRARPLVNLFLHLDRCIYQPQETIWFTGYILNRDEDLMREQNTLYVTLIDPVNKVPVLKKRFVMRNGFGKGFLALPDTLAAGDYWFLAYTNALLETGNEPVFRQLISVRTGEPSPFRISSATLLPDADSLRVKYKIAASYGGLAAGGTFSYTLSDSVGTIGTGLKTIDAFGEVTVTVGSRKDSGRYRDLAVHVSRNELSKNFIFPVYTGGPMSPSGTVTADKASSSPGAVSSANATFVSAKASPRLTVKITADSTEYHQRSQVKLKIQIRDQDGNPVVGIFSLAVAASRTQRADRIRSITQTDQSPDRWPASTAAIIALQTLAGDMPDMGYVIKDDGKIKKPVNLTLMGDNSAFFQTDSAGRFALPHNAMIADIGGANYVSVTDRSPERYKINIISRADTFDSQLAAIHYPIGTAALEADPEAEGYVFDGASRMLKAAVVKARVVSEVNPLSGEYNSTHCDQDYVCTHHHDATRTYPDDLNCPFVDRSPCELVKPKEGALYSYTKREWFHGNVVPTTLVVYHCAAPKMPAFMQLLDPILRPKTFPLPNPDGHVLLGSGRQSTVYWSHALTTDANGELTISFFTNNLTGNFTCNLQGVSAAGLLSGQATYVVQNLSTLPSAQTANIVDGH